MKHCKWLLCELLLIFAVMAVYGAWSVPDSNEPYYIFKAIRFWQPDFLIADTFLATPDAHTVFYLTFGWLSFFLSPTAMAWTGRVVAWLAMAWAWQRLSWAVIPQRGAAVLTALVFAYLLETCHFAGEWVFGGVEGKSFAFPFLFLGLEQLVRGRWCGVWLSLGVVSAFHVLVGGWGVVAAAVAWCLSPRGERTQFTTMIPSLLIGGTIALAGLIPVLALQHGVSPDVASEAFKIYTFDRLSHHLVPHLIPWTFAARFALLTLVAGLLAAIVYRTNAMSVARRRLTCFVAGAVMIAVVGVAIDCVTLLLGDRALAATLLRFYWFRLSDVAVPLGVAMLAVIMFIEVVEMVIKHSKKVTVHAQYRHSRVLGGNLDNTPQADATATFAQANHTALALAPRRVRGGDEVNCEQHSQKYWQALLVVLLSGVVMFLSIEAVLFRWLFFSWAIPADPRVAWLTVLVIGLCLALCHWQRDTTMRDTILLGVLGSLVVWSPLSLWLDYAEQRARFSYSRTEPVTPYIAYHWIDVCEWISENTPSDARFLVPREMATFKWHARRADVGVWKECPQDAASLLVWSRTLNEIFSSDGTLREAVPFGPLLLTKDDATLRDLSERYRFDYIVVTSYPQQPVRESLRQVYDNSIYQVFEVVGLASISSGSKRPAL